MAERDQNRATQAMDSARERAGDVLAGFTAGQKTMTVLAVVGLVLASMFFLRWASTPSLSPLYSGLAAEDAAAITEQLDAQGVGYELSDGGRTILVPREELYALRLDMSAQGLPNSSGSGYALLDEQGLTTSDFRQRVDFQRALEGELAMTIKSMDVVNDAMVHLVIPEEDLFTDDAEHASASVLLNVSGGMTPTPMQVQSIVNLVAASVEGLDPANVAITDSNGQTLAAPGEDGSLMAAGDARAYQTASFESRLADGVEAMLAAVVGPGNAVVTVAADLNYDRIEQTTETFGGDGPATGIPLQQNQTLESFEGDGGATVGVLGPDGGPLTTQEGEITNYDLNDTSTTFAVDRDVRQVLAAPGSVNRLSVAVLLDAESTVADAAEVQGLVEAAVGFDAARGDIVEVSALPFDTTAAEEAAVLAEEAAAAESRAAMFGMVRTGVVLLVVLVVLFMAWRSARRSLPSRETESIPIDLSELGVADDDPLELPEPEPRESLQEQVAALIDNQPEDVAGLLRGWMSE